MSKIKTYTLIALSCLLSTIGLTFTYFHFKAHIEYQKKNYENALYYTNTLNKVSNHYTLLHENITTDSFIQHISSKFSTYPFSPSILPSYEGTTSIRIVSLKQTTNANFFEKIASSYLLPNQVITSYQHNTSI